jgi:hypothetical protein
MDFPKSTIFRLLLGLAEGTTGVAANSYGFRPKRSPHRALAEVRRSLLRRAEVSLEDRFED